MVHCPENISIKIMMCKCESWRNYYYPHDLLSAECFWADKEN